MQEEEKQKVLTFLKKEMQALREVAALTEDLSEALDRKDEVTVLMCIDMRQEAMERTAEQREGLQLYLEEKPEITMSVLNANPDVKAFLAHKQSYIEKLKKTDERLNKRYLREESVFSNSVKENISEKKDKLEI